jgi:hypothetical protein
VASPKTEPTANDFSGREIGEGDAMPEWRKRALPGRADALPIGAFAAAAPARML